MNEIENNTSFSDEEEISLIDLFSVLIKHRFLICCGTILAFILAVVLLFIVPMAKKDLKRNVTIEYSTKFSVSKTTVAFPASCIFVVLALITDCIIPCMKVVRHIYTNVIAKYPITLPDISINALTVFTPSMFDPTLVTKYDTIIPIKKYANSKTNCTTTISAILNTLEIIYSFVLIEVRIYSIDFDIFS